MSKIGIIGLGWLGAQLAEHLLNEGHEVIGTVRTVEKKASLIQAIPKIELYDLTKGISTLIPKVKADFFFVSIPPSASLNYAFLLGELFTEIIENYPKATLIYTSSTSVYGNVEGMVSEKSSVLPKSENAIKIAQVEKYLIQHFADRSIILRLAGLVGKKRHPVNFLAGKKALPNANAVVNLIHAEDICRFVELIIISNIKAGVFNLCCEVHPRKSDYYQWASKQLNLEIPEFNKHDDGIGKTVLANKIKSTNFEFRYKSPYDFPISIN